jgi:hypothetical protein
MLPRGNLQHSAEAGPLLDSRSSEAGSWLREQQGPGAFLGKATSPLLTGPSLEEHVDELGFDQTRSERVRLVEKKGIPFMGARHVAALTRRVDAATIVRQAEKVAYMRDNSLHTEARERKSDVTRNPSHDGRLISLLRA